MRRARIRWCVLASVVAGVAAAACDAAGKPAPAGRAAKVTVRPRYEKGQMLHYNLKLSGATAWTPTIEGVKWGKMATDFTFVLKTKVLRKSGACTFFLMGEHLRSVGEGPKGAFGVDATRKKTRIKVKDRWQVSLDRSPLVKPMTMTFGPLGRYRYGTGLAPIAIYMLPHVDRRFWTLLTLAPVKEVAPGDKWEQEFQFPVPGAEGRPLRLKGKWEVLGWRKVRKQEVLAIALTAALDLKDSDLMLRNGDVVHVQSGTYKATGEVLWDVEGGRLCAATAEQKILVKVDKPSKRALRSECKCSLKLLGVK